MKLTQYNAQKFAALAALSLGSILLSLTATLLFLDKLYSNPLIELGPQKLKSVYIPGKQFKVLSSAEGQYQGDQLTISSIRGGEAIFGTQAGLRANDYSHLQIDIEGYSLDSRIYLFWSQHRDGRDPQFSELDLFRQGKNWISLQHLDRWNGDVASIAIGIFANEEIEPITFGGVKLADGGLEIKWLSTVGGWFHFSGWSQSSINGIILGSAANSSPPVVLGITWLLSLFIFWSASIFLKGYRSGDLAYHGLGWFLLMWILLDLIWQRQLNLQHFQSNTMFLGKTMHEKKMNDLDGGLYKEVFKIKQDVLPKPGPRIWLLTQERDSFLAHRVKYHLTSHQTVYYHNASFMNYLMRRLGEAEKGDFFIVIEEVSKLRVSSVSLSVRFYNFCWEGVERYSGDALRVIELLSDTHPCVE